MKLVQPRKMSLSIELPGPDRKRLPKQYHFTITYRNPKVQDSGCVMTWEVQGGRMAYQIALEQTPTGKRQWHCSCADAIFRGEDNPNHQCKHVQALREVLPS
jgi:hypothetical protein